jgi:hypothetical protein
MTFSFNTILIYTGVILLGLFDSLLVSYVID